MALPSELFKQATALCLEAESYEDCKKVKQVFSDAAIMEETAAMWKKFWLEKAPTILTKEQIDSCEINASDTVSELGYADDFYYWCCQTAICEYDMRM